jgi:hypothetical protein
MKQTIKLLIILSILNSALSESENLETSDSESAQKLSYQSNVHYILYEIIDFNLFI